MKSIPHYFAILRYRCMTRKAKLAHLYKIRTLQRSLRTPGPHIQQDIKEFNRLMMITEGKVVFSWRSILLRALKSAQTHFETARKELAEGICFNVYDSIARNRAVNKKAFQLLQLDYAKMQFDFVAQLCKALSI